MSAVASSAGYTMTTSRIRALEREMTVCAGRIQEQLDTLEDHLDRLRPQWTGEAADAYQRAQSQWSTSMSRLNTVLSDASARTGATLERHLQAREKVAALWR